MPRNFKSNFQFDFSSESKNEEKKTITKREVLSQTAWCMTMPAATETLKESTMPFIGILQCKSDSFKASSLIPLIRNNNLN